MARPKSVWQGGDRAASFLVLAGMALFVVAVFVAVVLGGGVLVGSTDSPHLGLSILATAVVAYLFEPVQSRLERAVHRRLYGDRLSPYDVLSRFSQTVTGAYASEELPGRMAKVLAEGTGSRWSQVWVDVNGRLVLAATWPLDADADPTPPDVAAGKAPGRRAVPVVSGPEVLGVLQLQADAERPLTPVEERLVAGLAAQAGLVLRATRLRAELAERAEELAARAEEVRRSQERLVAAQAEERHRLERDIHDGAQQHLVALAVNLRLAQTLARKAPERAVAVLTEQAAAAQVTIATLNDLSRGIYPQVLAGEGVAAALTVAAATAPHLVEVVSDGAGRYPAEVEAAVYFSALEAVQNAGKHAGATRISVRLSDHGGALEVAVEDDGCGFEAAGGPAGNGLANMRDRIDSVGGTLSIRSAPGEGTVVLLRVPVGALPDLAPTAAPTAVVP